MPRPHLPGPADTSKAFADEVERETKQGSPVICSVKDLDGATFTDSLERIEQKLEGLSDIPAKLQQVSLGIGSLQASFLGLERTVQKKAPALARKREIRSPTASASLGLRRGMSTTESNAYSDISGVSNNNTDRQALMLSLPTVQSNVLLEVQDETDRGSLPSSRSNKSRGQVDERPQEAPHETVWSPAPPPPQPAAPVRAAIQRAMTRDTHSSNATSKGGFKPNYSEGSHLTGGHARDRFQALPQALSRFFGSNDSTESANEFSLRQRASSMDTHGEIEAARAAAIDESTWGSSARYPWIVRPAARRRLLWDVLLIISMAVNAMVVSFSLVYNNDNGCLCSNIAATAAMHVADALWVATIPLNFITAFVAKNGQAVFSPWEIACHYGRNWLLFDLVTAWPRALLPSVGYGRWLFGLCALLRLLRLFPAFARVQRTALQFQCLILKTILAVALPAHILACFWRLSQRLDGIPDIEGGGTVEDWWPLYVMDAYWVLMTMTTVGYGDISPVGTVSRLFAIVAMLIASVFFGTMVSLTSQAISSVFNNPDERRVACALRFMRRRGVERELVSRVEHTLRRRLEKNKHKTMDSELFGMLTPAVQRELALALLQEVVLEFPLFQGVNRSFVGELAKAQTWMQCAPGDVVGEDGQLTREVVFVVQGRLSCVYGPRSDGIHLDMQLKIESGQRVSRVVNDLDFTHPDLNTTSTERRSRAVDQVIETGGWFGEACLFYDNLIRTATIIATEESDLAVLSQDDFFQIIQRYPRLLERHSSLKTALDQGKIAIEELEYRCS